MLKVIIQFISFAIKMTWRIDSAFYECLVLATREQWQVKTRRKNAKPQKDLKGNIKKSIDEAEWSRDFRNFYRYRNTSLAIKTTFFMSVNIIKTPLQSLGFLED